MYLLRNKKNDLRVIVKTSHYYYFCHLSTDILECSQDPNPCSQHCNELEGSYSCSCDETGYELDTDQATCIGKRNRGIPYLSGYNMGFLSL